MNFSDECHTFKSSSHQIRFDSTSRWRAFSSATKFCLHPFTFSMVLHFLLTCVAAIHFPAVEKGQNEEEEAEEGGKVSAVSSQSDFPFLCLCCFFLLLPSLISASLSSTTHRTSFPLPSQALSPSPVPVIQSPPRKAAAQNFDQIWHSTN